MYLIDNDGGDYQITDAPPPGFQETANQVIDLQERDLDASSLDELCMTLENALIDVERLAYHQVMLHKSLAAGVTTESAMNLRMARAHRAMLQTRYGFASKAGYAIESARYATTSSLIIAIEEEAKEEKGFFERMIKAIADAFRWLWKKIAGLFEKKKKSDSEEKIAKGLEKLKEAEAAGAKPPEGSIEADSLVQAFSFLGTSVTARMIEDHVKKQHQVLEKMESLLEVCGESFKRLVNLTKNREATSGDFKDMVSKNRAYMLMVVGTFKKKTPSDLSKYGIEFDASSGNVDTIHGYEGFLGDDQLLAWEVKHNDMVSWTAVFARNKENASSKIEYGTYGDLLSLTESVHALSKYNTIAGDRIKKLIEAAGEKSNIDALEANLNTLAEEASDEAKRTLFKETVACVREVGSFITKITSASAQGADSVTKALDAYEKYLVAAVSRVIEKAETKPDGKAV